MNDSKKSREELLAELKDLRKKNKELSHQKNGAAPAYAADTESIYKAIAAQPTLIIWTTDKNLKINYTTGGGIKAIGWTYGSSVGKSIYQFLQTKSPVDPNIIAHKDALKGKTTTYEKLWNGNFFELQVSPNYDKAGKICGCLGVANIITDRKKSEAEFQQNQETLSLLLSKIDELAYYIEYLADGKVNVKYIGSQTDKLLGLTREGFINQSPKLLLSRCHPDDVPAMIQLSERIKKTRKPQTMTYRFKHIKTNKFVWLEETIYPQVKKNIHVGNFGVTRDVTKKIDAERILKESEEKFRQLSKSSPVGIYLSDHTGNITYVNEKFRDITGIALKKVLTNRWFSLIHPQDAKRVISKVTRGVKNKMEYFEEFRVMRPNKRISWAKLHATTIRDEEGNVTGWVGIVEDITERRESDERIRESEERFRLLSAAALEGICLSENGRIIDANNRFLEMLGYNKKEEIFNRLFVETIVAKEDHERAHKGIRMESAPPTECRLKKKDGSIITVIIRGQNIPFRGKTVRVTVAYDISDRKRNEQELEKSKENYRRLIEQSPDGIFIHDEKGNVIFGNPSMLKIVGVSCFDDLAEKNIFAYTLPEYHRAIKQRKKSIAKGEEQDFLTVKLKRPDGRIVEVETKTTSFIYENKKATLVVCHDVSYERQLQREQIRAQVAEETNKLLQQEITERKRIEKQLVQNQKYTRNLIESSLDMICASDINGNVIEFNEAAQKTFGYKAGDVLGKKVEFLYANPQDRREVMKKLLHGVGSFAGEVLNRKKNGETFTAFLSASVLKNENGEIIGSMGVSRDISRIKIAEEQIKQSLREKEVLLKEVHHRVKNNLQVISSILNLQSSFVKDANTLNMLKESQNRIKSMAFIHESLYQNKDFSSINFSEYVINLSQNLVHSYEIYAKQVDLKLNVKKIFLNLDQAIPCGLVINEIVSNALKYAFPKGKKGSIVLSLTHVKDVVRMELSDNGVGLPKNIDYRNTESLGLQLVMSLVDQINGKIELDNRHGTKYIITFKNQKN